MRTFITNLLFVAFLFSITIFGQEEKDPSKPTNLYTQVNTNLEYTSGNPTDLYGLRANIQYAINQDNLLLLEVPFLYNNSTSKFGIYDSRVRYFAVVSRNITPHFIAIAPFIDVTAPTGKFENGLGTSAWSLGAGVLFGYVFSPRVALFPGVTFIHITKPNTDLIPEELKTTSSGLSLQFNFIYNFSKSTYININPTPTFLSTDGNWRSTWGGDVVLNQTFVPNKLKMNLSWSPNFTNEVHIFRLGATFFL